MTNASFGRRARDVADIRINKNLTSANLLLPAAIGTTSPFTAGVRLAALAPDSAIEVTAFCARKECLYVRNLRWELRDEEKR